MTKHPQATDQPRGAVRRALVIVPTYNERENIETLLAFVLGADPRIDILVVDDGSPDGTGDVVFARAASESRLHLIRRPGKSGLGSAYRTGFGWALGEGYDAVVEMDADHSHPADRLPALLDGLTTADVVIGSRWVPGGATRGWPTRRRLLSRAGNAYVRLALGMTVADATAGFRAFRSEALETIGATTLASEGYCFQVENTFVAHRLGLRVAEVPITFTERTQGASKMSGAIISEALTRVTCWAVGLGLPAPVRRRPRRSRCRSNVAAARALGIALAIALGLVAAHVTDRDAEQPSPRAGSAGTAASAPPGTTRMPTATSTRNGAGALPPAGEDAPPAPAAAGGTQPGEVPEQIQIPSIGVSSRIVGLALRSDGRMEVPSDPAQAGWLRSGAAPGTTGPAIIVGHVDSKTGPAVFYRLSKLQPGDEILVRNHHGENKSFTVRRVGHYAKDHFPTETVYGPSPGPVLRLITCGGAFDHTVRHYQDNVVVYAS